jgi:hypothetical protein
MFIVAPSPTMVTITRVPKGPSDMVAHLEKIVGFLVDEEGDDVETPCPGTAICVGGTKKEKPLFRSASKILTVDTNNEETEWLCMTDDGHLYFIEAERKLQ